uniref:Uncharacterized protein n=1 Tax=Ditylenchus dipsaci TaxID=166011 RepID=A0A915DWG5_9BILA
MADKRLKTLVKEAVKNWAEQVPIEYLSAIDYNFRMGQGPYVLSKKADDEEDSSKSDMDQAPDDQKEVCANEFGIKLTREDVDCIKPGNV